MRKSSRQVELRQRLQLDEGLGQRREEEQLKVSCQRLQLAEGLGQRREQEPRLSSSAPAVGRRTREGREEVHCKG